MENDIATEAQVSYILTLAKKGNIHYNTCENDELKSILSLREGIDFKTLTKKEATSAIERMKQKLNFGLRQAGFSRRAY